jgi:hypothetical protein
MTDYASTPYPAKNQRRKRRLERELRALHAMEGHLFWKDVLCAVLAIPALALLSLLVALKLHFAFGSVAFAVVGALACGAAIWWIGRRSFWLAVLIVFALVLILLETPPDGFNLDTTSRKELRRAKLAKAIARRKALLSELSR